MINFDDVSYVKETKVMVDVDAPIYKSSNLKDSFLVTYEDNFFLNKKYYYFNVLYITSYKQLTYSSILYHHVFIYAPLNLWLIYNALIKKYGNPYFKEKENNKALWIMNYEKAWKLEEKTKSFLKYLRFK